MIEWQDRWEWSPADRQLIAALKQIFPELRGFSSSRYIDPVNFWPTDFKQYRPEIGAAIIREMLSAESLFPDFQISGTSKSRCT